MQGPSRSTAIDVLLAMIDPDARRALEGVLRARGHDVTLCETVADLKHARRAERHRLLLVGGRFLAEAGLAAARRGRAASRPPAYVLAVAEDARTSQDCEGLLAAGANDVLIDLDERLTHARIAVAEELIRQAEAAEQAHATLERRAAQSRALADLGRRALAERALPPLLDAVAQTVATALDVEFVKIAQASSDGTRLVVRAGVGWKPGVVGRAEMRVDEGSQAGYALRSGEPVVVDDLRKETRFRGAALLREHGVVSGISVPVPGPDRPYGVLGAHTAHLRAFRREDVSLLAGIANVVGAAVARAAAEDRALAGEERARLVLENAMDAVVSTDAAGRVTEWNARAEETFGWTRVEAVGRPMADLVLPERDREAHRRALERFVLGGEGRTLARRQEVRARRRDGTEFPAEIALTPVAGAAGWTFTAFVRDLSDRERAERERRALDERVRVAEKAESLGVLAGGIAHDFNNLLTSVLGNVGLAQMHLRADSPARVFLAQVETAARRAADLTAQMLDYAGKGRMVLGRIDLPRLVEEMTGLLHSVVSRDVRLVTRHAPGLPEVEGDATQVRQVVMNLITNAAEACAGRAGEVVVTTSLVEVAPGAVVGVGDDAPLPPGPHVVLEVSDDGVGMDRETLARIFDPFFTTKRTGRGLGLAAVLGIVRGHAGAIVVSSEPGRGSAFRVFLPARAPAPEGPAPAAADRGWRGTGTVLLVDDEETVRDAGGALLRSLGFEVLEASDGADALRIFAERGDQIALVVLDLTMPRMDGARALERLREMRPDARVLVSSGYADDEVRSRFEGGQAPTGLLRKPYTLETLRDTVQRAVGP